MRNKHKRGPGESELDGFTKSRILLYIADHGESDRTDISLFLEQNYIMGAVSSVKNHLYDLVDEGLIIKSGPIPGKTSKYKLNTGYNNFRNIFNFLNDKGTQKPYQKEFQKELMRTRYYKEFIDSDEFQQKFPLHILRHSIHTFYDAIMSDEGYNQIIGEVEKLDPEKYANIDIVKTLLDEVRSGNPKDILAITILDLVKVTSTDDIDEIYKKIYERFDIKNENVRSVYEMKAGKDIPRYTFKIIYDFLVPESEKQNVLDMLKMSPKSIDYIINHSFYDSNILNLFTDHLDSVYRYNTHFKPSKMDYKAMKDKKVVNVFKLLNKPLENIDTSQVLSFYSITTIVKCLFISDIANGDINKDYSIDDVKRALYTQKEQGNNSIENIQQSYKQFKETEKTIEEIDQECYTEVIQQGLTNYDLTEEERNNLTKEMIPKILQEIKSIKEKTDFSDEDIIRALILEFYGKGQGDKA